MSLTTARDLGKQSGGSNDNPLAKHSSDSRTVRIRAVDEGLGSPIVAVLVEVGTPDLDGPLHTQALTDVHGEVAFQLPTSIWVVRLEVNDANYIPFFAVETLSNEVITLKLRRGCDVSVRLRQQDFDLVAGGALVFRRIRTDGRRTPLESREISAPLVRLGSFGEGGLALVRAGDLTVVQAHSRFALPPTGSAIVDFVSDASEVVEATTLALVGPDVDPRTALWVYRADHTLDVSPLRGRFVPESHSLLVSIPLRVLGHPGGAGTTELVYFGQTATAKVCCGAIAVKAGERKELYPSWEIGSSVTLAVPRSVVLGRAALWWALPGDRITVARGQLQRFPRDGTISVQYDDADVKGAFPFPMREDVSGESVEWSYLYPDCDVVALVQSASSGTLMASGHVGSGRTDLDLSASERRSVEFLVRGADDRCEVGSWSARVTLEGEGPLQGRTVRSVDGRVRINDLAPNDVIRVEASAGLCHGQLTVGAGVSSIQEILLHAVETVPTRVIVEDGHHKRVPGVLLGIWADDGLDTRIEVVAGADGVAEFAFSRASPFRASVLTPGFFPAAASGNGGDEAVISTGRTCLVLLRNFGPGREVRTSVRGPMVFAIQGPLTLTAGAVLSLATVPEGLYEIRVEDVRTAEAIVDETVSVDPTRTDTVVELR